MLLTARRVCLLRFDLNHAQFGANLLVGFWIQEHFWLMTVCSKLFIWRFYSNDLFLVKLGEPRSFLPIFMGLAMARCCLGWWLGIWWSTGLGAFPHIVLLPISGVVWQQPAKEWRLEWPRICLAFLHFIRRKRLKCQWQAQNWYCLQHFFSK